MGCSKHSTKNFNCIIIKIINFFTSVLRYNYIYILFPYKIKEYKNSELENFWAIFLFFFKENYDIISCDTLHLKVCYTKLIYAVKPLELSEFLYSI